MTRDAHSGPYGGDHPVDADARQQLISRHLRLVRHVARQVQRKLPREAEYGDLLSAGTIGLMQAVDNFDPARGLAFSTFAAPRIRGAILDDLRRWDRVPRSMRRKQRQMSEAREALRAELRRDPTTDELARRLGVDRETAWQWEVDANGSQQLSLDQRLRTEDGVGATPLDILVGDEGRGVEVGLEREEKVALLKQAITELPERERTVLALYYYEDLKLREIAEVLGVTESRVSQIRSHAVNTLRGSLAGHTSEAH